MSLAKARRATSLSIFGRNIVVNSLVATYFEYYGANTLWEKKIY